MPKIGQNGSRYAKSVQSTCQQVQCMLKFAGVLLTSLGFGFALISDAQSGSATMDRAVQPRVVIGPSDKASDTVIAVPPDTSWKGSISFRPASPSKSLDAGSAADWIHSQSALNGLQSADIRPWHIVIAYDQFDEDGDNVHSGIVEEYWAGPKKYRISYRSDTLNQTDYATEQGLFRLGDQRWPNREMRNREMRDRRNNPRIV